LVLDLGRYHRISLKVTGNALCSHFSSMRPLAAVGAKPGG
ncbi:hypothetical protein THAOC_16431, partial [Thalassiosira oceanica]